MKTSRHSAPIVLSSNPTDKELSAGKKKMTKEEIEECREKWRCKNKKYKMSHYVSNEHKFYFKGRKQEKRRGEDIGTRAKGICKLWERKSYERRAFIDGIE